MIKTVTLTVEQIPAHSHGRRTSAGGRGGASGDTSGSKGYQWHDSGNSNTTETGGGKAHDNMPPYITVYMFRRTA